MLIPYVNINANEYRNTHVNTNIHQNVNRNTNANMNYKLAYELQLVLCIHLYTKLKITCCNDYFIGVGL